VHIVVDNLLVRDRATQGHLGSYVRELVFRS